MVESTTTTFRFPNAFHEGLGLVAKELGTTRAGLVQQSVDLAARLIAAANRETIADLHRVRAAYPEAKSMLIAVDDEDGVPHGRVLIDGSPDHDVVARPYVDQEAGEAHIFLDVAPSSHPTFATIGREAIFLFARAPLGKLPWPPRPQAISIDFADLDAIERAMMEAEPSLPILVEV